jgi:hypothetical protein
MESGEQADERQEEKVEKERRHVGTKTETPHPKPFFFFSPCHPLIRVGMPGNLFSVSAMNSG